MIKVNVILDNDNAVADCHAKEHYISELKKAKACHAEGGVFTSHISTCIQMNWLRIGVMQGDIEPFSIMFNGNQIHCDKRGQLSQWPKGLFDELGEQVKILMRGPGQKSST